ncbi:MAG TPA: hypothetical protein VGQ53_14850 [Chitinophagaceae bacterium]|jgi:hypothetical protein|nr:hypothetical protein [Chitinophagaceae bacterium]
MLTNLPDSAVIIFLLTVILTFLLFVNAVKNKATVAIVLVIWLAVTGVLSFKEVFQNTSTIPPRLMMGIAPAAFFIILLLVTKGGRRFTDSIDLKKLTLVHIVRVPVEVTLFMLSTHKLIPELMTFAGRNLDILSGITAPIMYLVCFRGSVVKNRKLLLVWNFICLGLLLNIVINAILAAPFPFQQFAFDQPNIAVLYFPFTWLPFFIVMIVLYSHLAAIRQLIRS